MSTSASQQQGSSSNRVVGNLITGVTIAAGVKSVFAPIERTKLLIARPSEEWLSKHPEQARNMRWLMPEVMKRAVQEQGLSTLWRGNLTNCLRYAPTRAVILSVNDELQRRVAPTNSVDSKTPQILLAAGVAGVVGMTLFYPFDVARARLASDIRKGKNMNGGLLARMAKPYQGYALVAPGAFMLNAIHLGGYRLLKTYTGLEAPAAGEGGGAENTTSLLLGGVPHALVLSAVARAAAIPIVHPLDMVRRRMVLQRENKLLNPYKNSLDCLTTIVRKEGMRTLYFGASSYFRTAFATIITVALFDRVTHP